MADFEGDDFEDMLVAFILGVFADGPRSISEMRERVEGASSKKVSRLEVFGRHRSGWVVP